MQTIGIDIGTTSICGILMNSVSGKIEKSLTLPNNSFIRSDKPWEKIQDTEIIMKTVYQILGELADGNEIGEIGISGQMHGIVYCDGGGNAVSPLFIWQDERGNLPYKDGETYAKHLNSFAGYGMVTDFYNRVNSLVPKSAKSVCTIGDYAGMRICGNSRPVMHISNAGCFGCFDCDNNKFTLDNGMLPEVTAEFKIIGEYNGAKVVSAIGDNQASFMGSVCGNSPLVNVGTGSQVSYLSDTAVEGKNIESRLYDGKSFLVVGSALCGGRAFALLERFFASVVELATGEKCGSLYPQMDNMLKNIKPTDMTADSRFCGTRAEPDVRASFSNITQENFTAQDMTTAMLYAIADELHSMYAGGKCESVVCSGNGIRKNPALQRVVSEIFGAEIKIPEYSEEASYGAALAALTAAGKFSTLQDAQKLIKYR